MAKKRATVKTSEPALFSTEQYSSGIGDIEQRSLIIDPYWNEIESESVKQVTLDLDRLIPANVKIGLFIIEQSDNDLHLGIVFNTNESGFFVNWLNFGESTKDINFLCGTNCFNNWERDQEAISKLAIAPNSLVDRFLEINPSFSLKNEYGEFKVGDRIRDTFPGNPRKGVIVKICRNWAVILWDNSSNPSQWSYSYLEHFSEFGNLKSSLIKQNEIYLHSSGKRVKVHKVLKGRASGFVDGYFEGDPILERIAISDLAEIGDQLVREDLQVGDNLGFTIGDRIYSQQLKRSGEVVKIGKSGFSIEWQGWVKVPYSFSQIEELQLSKVEESISCSHTPHSLPESVVLNSASNKQEQNELSAPESSLKTIDKPNESLVIDFQELNSTQTLETGNQNQENIISTQSDFPAQVHQLLVTDQDLNIQNQVCGSMPCERSPKENLISLLLKTPQDLSTTDLEQFLEDSEWLTISGKIRKSYQQRNSAHPMKEKGFSSLPTPTTYPKGSTGCRPAGTNRLEQKLRPYIAKGDKLHPAVAQWMMGFPSGWVERALADTGELLSVQPPLIPVQATTSTTAAIVLTSTVEQLHPNRPVLPLNESVTLQNSPELLTPTNTDKETTTQGKTEQGEVSTILITPTIQVERGQGVENRGETSTSTITKIKAVTLHQPWASLVGKFKNYETRGKATNYRGKIAIHAAIRQEMTDYQVNELADLLVGENIPFGCIIAIADLTDCIRMTEEFISQQSETELRCGLWEVGRYAWKLENVQFLSEPIPARGMPGLWDFELPIISSQELGVRSQEGESSRQEAVGRSQEIDTSPQSPVTSYQLSVTKPIFKTGEYVLNGRVGEIIEDSPGEYFVVKYSSNDLKCYFWGQDDELIDQIVIASPELIAQFVRENKRENKEAFRQEAKTKKTKVASGSLAPFLENKKLKDGTIVTYPRVTGERDKLNYDHWRWGYYYEIKVNSKWQNKSLPVPARIAPLVREMIDKDYPVGEIKNFILQCKNKKGGGRID